MAFQIPYAGANHTLVPHERPGNNHVVELPKGANPSDGSVVALCSRAVGIMSAAVVTFCHCSSGRRKLTQMPRADTSRDFKAMPFEMGGEVPVSRLGRVLSKLRPRRRRADGQEVHVGFGNNPHSEGIPGVEPDVNMLPPGYGMHYFGTQGAQWQTPTPAPYELPPTMESQLRGPVPAYIPSVDMPDRDVNMVGQYRPHDASPPVPAPSFDITNAMPSMPSPTMPHPSDRHSRRVELPAPLVIVPHTTSLSIARTQSDATSTYNNPYSPYEHYTPYMVSPAPSSSSYDDAAPSFGRQVPQSLHSSNSNRSTKPPRSATSIQSTGPPPSMTRSISSGPTESLSLPPPTPNYLQSQRAPIDSDNIVCLGPLPGNISLPSLSPKHLQFQPQRPAPKVAKEQDSSIVWPAARPLGPIQQDPLLHDSSPLPPYQSPVAPIFTREHSLHAHKHHGEDRHPERDPRRRSTDSLGSNFTVEEEARIQAQIVRNLSMLGQERVGGEGDIVHIPQPSARRFSFEDDR